ncbi:hypothetical protein BXZ70DRAFT_729756 [Cristinia sonorae]|uniref:NmrA-like domain-containing protein n=1 Tax=Cristinia sonorae TaxID=1940300 RepID=A0A8K0UU68_9AGAR|nr:hypothetical protein BXZ70DRAFT_729756 [Cristinia sonorae]
MSSQSRVVAVIGASGVQGLSVVNALLDTFPVHAYTRDASKLKHLSHPNLTVVEVDINDSTALKAALKNGVWALFANNLSDYTKPIGAEEALGKNIVDAAAEAGVEWLVYSSMPEGNPFRAFVEKSNVMKYAREVTKRSQLKNVFVEVGAYMSNSQGNKPVLNPADGVVEFTWIAIDAQTYLPLISTDTDLGPIVKAVLQNPDEWNDAEIPVVADPLTVTQMAEVYSKVYNVPTRVKFLEHAPPGLPFGSIMEDLLGSFKDPGYFPAYVGREREIAQIAKRLFPGVRTWETYLREVGLDYIKN